MPTLFTRYFLVMILVEEFLATISIPRRTYIPCKGRYHVRNSTTRIYCTSIGEFEPIFTWNFTSTLSSFSRVSKGQIDVYGARGSYTSFLEYAFIEEGNITCSACDSRGCAESTCPVYLSTSEGNYDDPQKPLENTLDLLELVCLTLRYFCEIEIERKNISQLITTDKLHLEEEKVQSKYMLEVTSDPIEKSDPNVYSCRGECRNGERKEVVDPTSMVSALVKPRFVDTNMMCTESVYDIETTHWIILKCYVRGAPRPKIYWQKDHVGIVFDNETQTKECGYVVFNKGQELHIQNLSERCSGDYQCIAGNRLDTIKSYVQSITINMSIYPSTTSSSSQISIKSQVTSTSRPSPISKQLLSSSSTPSSSSPLPPSSSSSPSLSSSSSPSSSSSSSSLSTLSLSPSQSQSAYSVLHSLLLSTTSPSPSSSLPSVSTQSSSILLPTSPLPSLSTTTRTTTATTTRTTTSSSSLSQLPSSSTEWPGVMIICIVIFFIGCLITVIYVWMKMRRMKTVLKGRQLTDAGLVNFKEGSLSCLNPDLTVDEQVEFLPYDKRWEFPREKLKTGKQLGSGAFGVVMKAEAEGICDAEMVTTVAVKMVRRNSELSYIRALANELKILVHLGKHINVVNLLGACTKNIHKRELFVIVEYCHFGNLQNYLMRHRSEFRKENTTTRDTDSLSSDHDDNPVQNSKTISLQDLMSWSFQVASGMEYLCLRKVLHGDLAARNILLTETKVVKICDFGLSKTMYKYDQYKKKSDTPLPFKWMAIESIRDGIFSTQSDVWSFGIVLWEFFTLAQTPYPGMDTSKQYAKLIEGYRLEKPEFASQEIYDIILQCWRTEPSSRPSFSALVESIGNLLDVDVRQHFVNLNSPYVDMNRRRFAEGECDYLANLSAPDHRALSSPFRNYVNSCVSVSVNADTHIL